MATAYIGLGSNMGDREKFLCAALDALSQSEGIEVEAVSSVYETAPIGFTEQAPFLNAVAKVSTGLEDRELLHRMRMIETKLGRRREKIWGPRTIDLDLLFYDDRVVDDGDLILPHPRLERRAFVLVPLCEIDPELVHPILKKTVLDLLRENCQGQSIKLVGRLDLKGACR